LLSRQTELDSSIPGNFSAKLAPARPVVRRQAFFPPYPTGWKIEKFQPAKPLTAAGRRNALISQRAGWMRFGSLGVRHNAKKYLSKRDNWPPWRPVYISRPDLEASINSRKNIRSVEVCDGTGIGDTAPDFEANTTERQDPLP